jgi:hypothetical protein
MTYGALSLLDHQMIDRDGRACGNVDDLELELRDDGALHVVAILAGPGVLAERLGRPRLGAWLRRASGDPGMERIPWWRVSWIDSRVRLAVQSDELATFARERWARDRFIARIPGNGIDNGGGEGS